IVAIAEDLAIVYLGSIGDRRFTLDLSLITIGFLGTVLTFPLMGALIVQRRPTTRVAWLMIGLGLSVGLGLFTYAYGVVGSPPALVAVLAVIALAISLPDIPNPIDDIAFGLGLTFVAAMPLAIGIAITRYRLYEIDRLINRALVYGSLTAILAGVFTAGIGLAQRLFVAATRETSDAAIVGTTLIVATLYAPLRKRPEALVDRAFKYEAREIGAYRGEL